LAGQPSLLLHLHARPDRFQPREHSADALISAFVAAEKRGTRLPALLPLLPEESCNVSTGFPNRNQKTRLVTETKVRQHKGVYTREGSMEDIVRYRALEAFCRQRAQMEGEGSAFWLAEADILAQLIIRESQLKIPATSHEEERRLPNPRA
jgi:hypothetical protein